MNANDDETMVVDQDTAMGNDGAATEQNPADSKPTYKSFKYAHIRTRAGRAVWLPASP